MNLWIELKPYFNRKNLFHGFLIGLVFSGLALWSIGSFSWAALIFVPVLTIGVPLLKARNDVVAQNYEDRL